MSEIVSNWWDVDVPSSMDSSRTTVDCDVSGGALMMMALKGNQEFFRTSESGHAPESFSFEQLYEEFVKKGFFRFRAFHDRHDYVLVRGDSSAHVEWYPERRILRLGIATLDKSSHDWVKGICNTLEPELIPHHPSGSVCAMLQTMAGVQIHKIGVIRTELQRENYMPEALVAYDKIVADLNSDAPRGRIAIFDGPAGTGKTFMIRSLFTSASRCTFVVVPPKMVQDLGSPDLLNTLLSHKNGAHPLVLVLEDADEVISERKAKTMSGLSSLLNMGDGVLGDLINARVIATTNSPIQEIDEAMKRPGRLSARVEAGRLSPTRASAVVKRLWNETAEEKRIESKLPDSYWEAQSHTLAEAYAAAVEFGWQPPSDARGVENDDEESPHPTPRCR